MDRVCVETPQGGNRICLLIGGRHDENDCALVLYTTLFGAYRQGGQNDGDQNWQDVGESPSPSLLDSGRPSRGRGLSGRAGDGGSGGCVKASRRWRSCRAAGDVTSDDAGRWGRHRSRRCLDQRHRGQRELHTVLVYSLKFKEMMYKSSAWLKASNTVERYPDSHIKYYMGQHDFVFQRSGVTSIPSSLHAFPAARGLFCV